MSTFAETRSYCRTMPPRAESDSPTSGGSQLLLEWTTTWLVVGGCALGFWAVIVDRVAPRWVGNIAALWFLAGFLAGRSTRRAGGALRGVICLVSATIAYYGLRVATDSISIEYLAGVPVMWLVAGIASGAVSGRLGQLSYLHPYAWGAPAGVFAGEAIVVMFLRQRLSQAALELVCALACVALARARWQRAVVVAAGTIPVVGWLAGMYRIVLR